MSRRPSHAQPGFLPPVAVVFALVAAAFAPLAALSGGPLTTTVNGSNLSL